MENYIVINGKKAELTEEQLKQLGIEVEEKRNNPFKRHSNERYWFINTMGASVGSHDNNNNFDNDMYNKINYFNDYKFAKQVALHQLLYRKLLKYAWDNEAEDYDEWDNDHKLHYYIIRDKRYHDRYVVTYSDYLKDSSTAYFSKKGVAENAIEDIVKPFMKEHPEFVW